MSVRPTPIWGSSKWGQDSVRWGQGRTGDLVEITRPNHWVSANICPDWVTEKYYGPLIEVTRNDLVVQTFYCVFRRKVTLPSGSYYWITYVDTDAILAWTLLSAETVKSSFISGMYDPVTGTKLFSQTTLADMPAIVLAGTLQPAPRFDASGDSLTSTITANTLFTGANGFTFAAWLRHADVTQASTAVVAHKSSSATIGADGFTIRKLATGLTGLRCVVDGGSNVDSSSGFFATNVWVHMIVTIAATGAIKIYKNNVEVGSGTSSATLNIDTTEPLIIGAGNWWGNIRDAIIFNKIISSTEREVLAAA